MTNWQDSGDELRDLDAALGDGDLGITVTQGAKAVCAILPDLREAAIADIVKRCGMAFSSANPSTFAALVGGGLLAAGKTVAGDDDLTPGKVLEGARVVAESIKKRGKCDLGDKTILDAILPSLDAAEAAADGQRLAAAIDAARKGLEETTPLQSKKGRAAWLRERSAGSPDPGATAYVRFLESLQLAFN